MSYLRIWQADLRTDHPGWALAEAALSPTERERQARLHTPALRQTYGRAHAFLRAILSHNLKQPAGEIIFKTDRHGKPQLAANGPCFNLSYRPGRALLAIANCPEIGVDIELIRPLADADALVTQLFSAQEQAALQAAAPADYWPLFYLIWTRKEAYAKKQGMGLFMPFAAFSVLKLGPAGQVELVEDQNTRILSSRQGEYQVAVAIPPVYPRTRHFTYEPGVPNKPGKW